MSLSKDEVDRIARLARLAVRPEESAAVIERLNRVLGMIETMRAVDTRQVEPMAHALDVVQRLRADEVTEVDQHVLFQSIAPAVERDLYLVPKVIE
ncbi:MAG: Asp-tRNA(Asn)/Glu-tRNA(Gln) amidotransferase subunit GatC [Betaproteobacteria bacterium]|jgi:aspartyl-tRNA(Asn)/glutamyl-tRNA(Gln) amidotransferase subunit C|nr:Asp-tRNA(Asn)/Glu-tRNA(Gln) amidotransferase subunit GatC [Betaproteobacteria bacterium]